MRLFIIMRNDLDSMNPGKAAAQAAHAANQAVLELEDNYPEEYHSWLAFTSGGQCLNFGTTIVLEGTIEDIIEEYNEEKDDSVILQGLTEDPTYPVKDGSVVHEVDIITCAWFWVKDQKYIFKYAGLMR